ncbi:hypothetical protein EBP70_14175 [Escherichia coli O119]|nr:hypothetical protein [Escherichia coli O119]
MSEGPGGPQGATAGGTLAMRMLSQQAMVASQMKRAANDKAIAQMLAAKKSGPPAARLGDEIQHKSFLGALAGAVLGAIVTIAEGCLIMAACATGPYALVLVPALMYASYKASDYVEEKQNQLESWINSFCDTDGAINTGSENVNINGKPAARAAVTLPPPPPPGAIPEIPQGEPSWGDIATDLLESAAEKAVPLAKAWGNAVITLTESNAGFMDRVSAGASLLFPAGPVLMEFATMVGGRGEIKKDVDFPEAGEDTALCDKENKPPRIAQGSSNVFINNQPAARKGDKLECSAAIVEGSPDVFIGGEQVTYLDIQPEFPPWQRMILGGITIASYLLPPAGLLGKLGNLAKLGKLGNLLGKSGKLLGAKLGALLGKTGKSLKSIANKVIRWVTDPVDPVTGAYCDERTDFTLGQTLPLSFTRFHSSVLPLHGLTGVGWSDSWSEYAWVREQGNRVDIISLGATLNFAFDGESDTAVNPYHAQYILRRRDDYLELFDRDALSSRFFYDAFPGMRLRHPVTDDTSDDRLAHSPADRMYMLGGMSDTASNRITFERDSQYRITGVSHTDGIRLKLTYHASGYLKAIHRTDNGIQTLATYEQDARGRLTEADARLDYHLFYEYDAADRIIRWSDTGENGVMMPVKNPMSGTGLRWKPLRDQIFFLAVEQQLPLNGQNGASDTMLRASASFFNGGKYSDEWHPNGSGWFAQNLYLDAAQYIRQDIQAWTADYRVSWHQKVANGQTIEPYAHVQDNGYRDKGTQGAQLGGVGVRWNIWTGETHYDAWPHKVSLGVEYQHTFKAINQRNGERNNAFLTIGVHW